MIELPYNKPIEKLYVVVRDGKDYQYFHYYKSLRGAVTGADRSRYDSPKIYVIDFNYRLVGPCGKEEDGWRCGLLEGHTGKCSPADVDLD